MDSYEEGIIDLFKSIDVNEKGHIYPIEILDSLKVAGILRDDPRIEKLVETIDNFPRERTIGKHEFADLIRHLYHFLYPALRRGLILDDFKGFCSHIKELYDLTKENQSGEVASYIPELARVNPDQYGISICTVDGQRYSIGDSDKLFCVQSSSKPITYCIALEDRGEEVVHKHVGREPSGRGFNELTLNAEGLPHNPLINSGAIMCASLIKPDWSDSPRINYITDYWQRLSGGARPNFDLSVYLSERDSADRNYALAYFMREKHAFEKKVDINNVLKLYFQCCSLQQTTKSMAIIAATFAKAGVCPITGDRIFSPIHVKHTLSMMASCGMYDFSGEYAFTVGLPAKSGVSGILMIVVPNVMGIAVWSPRLDRYGNTSRGVQFSIELVKRFNFHNYDSLILESGKIDPRNDTSKAKQVLATFVRLSGELNRFVDMTSITSILDHLLEVALDVVRAEKGTIFVNDEETHELYAFIDDENGKKREVRFPNDKGIAGAIYQSGEAEMIDDPYSDPRFNKEVDKKTGFKTRSILCVPIRTFTSEVIGVVQLINSRYGNFSEGDVNLINLIISQSITAISFAHRRKKFEEKHMTERTKEKNEGP